MDKPEVQLGAKVKFLEAELFAGFSHEDKKDILIIKQLNAGDQATGLTIEKIATSIAETIKKISEGKKPEEKVTLEDNEKPEPINWPPAIKEVLEAIEVKISQVYLYVASEEKEEKEVKRDVEYAIGIGINLTKEQKDKISKESPFDLIQLEELFLKIWRTDNPEIKKEMNIIDFEKEVLALDKSGSGAESR